MRRALILSMFLALAVITPAIAAEHGGTEATAEKKKKDDKDKAVHKITQSDSYMMIDPLYASIMDGNRPLGLLMVGIGLDVPDPALRERIEREMPRLRDGYVRNMTAFAGASVRSYRQPDVTLIADRLQGVTDRLLARKGARVLLAQVAIRLNK
jgi:flagellar basal body-associated protein FliL